MLNFQPVQCADGRWMQLGNLLSHLQVNFLQAAGLADILNDPLFGKDPPDEAAVAERLGRTVGAANVPCRPGGSRLFGAML